MPLLEVRNLTVDFATPQGARRAVDGVSFSIDAAESLGLVGESGSGKSVSSLAILGLLPPQARVSGEIYFDGRDLLKLQQKELRPLRGASIAMIFQEPMTALNPVMKVGEQVAEALTAHGVSRREARLRAVEALEEVAIPEPAERAQSYPHQLSGGQRQRVMIAMALINKPSLLIADEPTTALDVTVQAQILELIAELRRSRNLSLLFISHDLAVVAGLCERAAVMYGGRIVEMAAAKEIFLHPRHAYTQGLLASSPSLTSDRTKPLGSVAEAAKTNVGELRELAPGHWLRA